MTNKTGRTTAALNMRSGPGTQFGVVTVLQPFTPVIITAENGDWLTITASGRQGFVHKNFVTVNPEPDADHLEESPAAADTGRTKTIVNLRAGPGREHRFKRRLPANTAVNMIRKVGTWYKVQLPPNGLKGYIHENFVVLDIVEESIDTGTTDPQTSTQTGFATSILNMRSGPGTENGVIAQLPLDTELKILEHQGEWLKVSANNQTGFVHSAFVLIEFEGMMPGVDPNDPNLPALPDIPLKPAENETITLPSGASGTDKRIARTWNRFGGLLTELSARLNVDPGVAVAVLVAESGGRGFSSDRRMIIRFENHVFNNMWGKANPAKYAQHFRYDSTRVWVGHQWRPTANEAWRSFHGNQSREWEALNFAMSLDDTAAKKSISMGGPQIMGFNFTSIGYESVQQMFTAFSATEAHQIVGFFDFVKGRGGLSQKVLDLQRLDFDSFAAQYNGPGQAAKYGQIIRNLFEAYQRLRGF